LVKLWFGSLEFAMIEYIPLTSLKSGRRIHPTEVLIKKGNANPGTDSLALTYQIRTISKRRILKLIGSVKDQGKQKEIETAIKLHLDLR
jgi:mRNA interferase MazF